MKNIWVLHSFSPFLSQQGAPKGTLMRKCRGEISAEEIANLTLDVVDEEPEHNPSHRK